MSGDSRPRYGLHRPSKQFGYRKYMYAGNGRGCLAFPYPLPIYEDILASWLGMVSG